LRNVFPGTLPRRGVLGFANSSRPYRRVPLRDRPTTAPPLQSGADKVRRYQSRRRPSCLIETSRRR